MFWSISSKTSGSGFRRNVSEAIVRIEREKTEGTLDRETVNKFLTGDVSIEVPPKNRIVRIFTSSTFTDTMYERNWWMQRAYPELRSFCQMRGYEFQVVDMRWGVRDEASDDHTTLDLCMNELRLCQELSTGPNFISLLANKYGYRAPPRTIPVDQFNTLLGVVENEYNRALLNKWYLRDDNAVPPEYVLQPISRVLPNIMSKDAEQYKAANDQWTSDIGIIQTTLDQAARQSLPENEAEKYYVSITEKEVQAGLLDVTEPEKHCLWFWRTIDDIENLKNQDENIRRKFIDMDKDEDYWRESRRLLSVLQETKMKSRLPPRNLYQYKVKWTKDGIDPKNAQHKDYLKAMTEKFTSEMERLIEDGIKQRTATEFTNPLILECCQHVRFCQQKCENFCGRETTLAKIEAYIKSASTKPLIIHGASGCGKTSLVAMTASLIKTWMSNTNPTVILRFIGTTPDSSNISGLLINIIKQIHSVYNKTSKIPGSLRELTKETELILKFAKASQPLVIILDALDQIDASYNARSLSWVPRTLPKHVKLIVSTLEDADFECYPKLKVMFKDEDQFVSLPELTTEEAETILHQWLRSRKRTLSFTQMTTLTKCVLQRPLPLFLKLSIESAAKWHSYWTESETILQQTVQDSITYLFSKLESKHGQMFVSRTLGYLTASRNGLSESELEDILSCDDSVLNDVYQYWEPPIRRLPPLLLVRLKTDLQHYIVERGSDGISVMNWYHRQFKETADNRYCGLQEVEQVHTGLADFFNGKWANEKKKPYVYKEKPGEADRHVSSQPLIHRDSYNLRRLNNAPYHLVMEGNISELKKTCLMNFEFLQAKVVATSVRHILDDFAFARKKFPNDSVLDIVGAALEMSQGALQYDPMQLAPQLLDRLSGEANTADLLNQCQQCSVPYLAPDQEVLIKPGGQLVFCLTGHHGPVTSVDVRGDGKLAVSCSDDNENSVKTWDLIEGRLHRSYDGINDEPTRVRFICNDKTILVDYVVSYTVIQESGEVAFSIDRENGGQSIVGGKGKTLLALFYNATVQVYDLENGESVTKFDLSDPSTQFCDHSMTTFTATSENFAVLTDSGQHYVIVFSFADQTVSEWFQIFNPKPESNQADLQIDAIAITPDEKQFILSSSRDNDLHIYDLVTRNKIGLIKGLKADFAQNYRISENGNLLYFPGDGIVVWDLAKKQRSCIFSHLSCVSDAICWSWKTMVTTIEDDSTIYVWDMEKKEKETKNKIPVLGHKIRYFLPLRGSRYVVVVAQIHRNDKDSCNLQVYDVQKKNVVRSTMLDKPPGVIKILDDKRIAIVTSNRKIKTINLDNMTVDKVMDGDVSGFTIDIHVRYDGTEILTQTRGRKHFKRYDAKTGKTKDIIRRPVFVKTDRPFEEMFYVSKDWNVLAARILKGPWLLFDIRTFQCIFAIPQEHSYNDISVAKAALSDDGQSFLFGVSSNIKRSVMTRTDKETPTAFVIWDVGKCEMVAQCDDVEYQQNYAEIDNRKGLDVSVDEIHVIDANRLLTAHDDFVLRVWNRKTGDLVSRLEGHNSAVDVCMKETGPYFFSYELENAIRVWEKSTLRCLASFRLENTIVACRMCEDSQHIITSTRSPTARLVYWRLKAENLQTRDVTGPELFKGIVTKANLDVETTSDNMYTEDDPDTDADTDY
ncbi:NACHT domain- and WD repeat-containing protein 1-like [Ylistrum balloti]|uniref:NACHT domain- and WD repeat-containing protein 1-like n=1 Tax=Ylistrum balloti TaxID=509963 RepID=UPI002905E8F6|nr:NACHT domain- and WD repeat-containing protein 1-like [Ylistrum balloti]